MENFAGTDISAATLLAGLFIANIAGILGSYVSMRERIKVLEVKVDDQKEDLDAAHEKIRQIEKEMK